MNTYEDVTIMDTSCKLYNEQRTELSNYGELVRVHVHYSLKTSGDYCKVLESGRVFSYDLDEQLFLQSWTEKRRLFPVTCVSTKKMVLATSAFSHEVCISHLQFWLPHQDR